MLIYDAHCDEQPGLACDPPSTHLVLAMRTFKTLNNAQNRLKVQACWYSMNIIHCTADYAASIVCGEGRDVCFSLFPIKLESANEFKGKLFEDQLVGWPFAKQAKCSSWLIKGGWLSSSFFRQISTDRLRKWTYSKCGTFNRVLHWVFHRVLYRMVDWAPNWVLYWVPHWTERWKGAS